MESDLACSTNSPWLLQLQTAAKLYQNIKELNWCYPAGCDGKGINYARAISLCHYVFLPSVSWVSQEHQCVIVIGLLLKENFYTLNLYRYSWGLETCIRQKTMGNNCWTLPSQIRFLLLQGGASLSIASPLSSKTRINNTDTYIVLIRGTCNHSHTCFCEYGIRVAESHLAQILDAGSHFFLFQCFLSTEGHNGFLV